MKFDLNRSPRPVGIMLFAIISLICSLVLIPASFAEKAKDETPKKKHHAKKIAKPSTEPDESNGETPGNSAGVNNSAANASDAMSLQDTSSKHSSADTPAKISDPLPEAPVTVDMEDVDPEEPQTTGTPGPTEKHEPILEIHHPLLGTVTSTTLKKDAGVFVNCSTPGAKVRIDGILKGNVNEIVIIGSGGMYDIDIFAPGYMTYKVQRKIPDGETVSFDVTLQAISTTAVQPAAVIPPPAPVETGKPLKDMSSIAGAWRVEFKGSSKAILRKDSIVEIQQSGTSITMYADTYLPERSMLSMKEWDLQTKYRWTGTFENHKLNLKSWKGQLQLEATISDDGTVFEGKVNSSINRYHTFVNLKRL
ncbi:MAG: PEGA domain-containing protein [Candidatus Riflebacteria bacterium]|nr:PEGA domain-containing protein [Candidatus Riflebacteria bacterium]